MVVQIAVVSISSEHTATKHAKNLSQSESRVSLTNGKSSKTKLNLDRVKSGFKKGTAFEKSRGLKAVRKSKPRLEMIQQLKK